MAKDAICRLGGRAQGDVDVVFFLVGGGVAEVFCFDEGVDRGLGCRVGMENPDGAGEDGQSHGEEPGAVGEHGRWG